MEHPDKMIEKSLENEKNIIRCRYCGKPIESEKQVAFFGSDFINNEATVLDLNIYFCEKCNMPLINLSLENIVCTNDGNDEYNVLDENDIYPIYPYIEKFEGDLGEYKEDYEQAIAVHGISPRASCVLLRRLIEKILKIRYKINENKLDDAIYEFYNEYKFCIPYDLVDSLYRCKKIGNNAAHLENITIEDFKEFNDHLRFIFQKLFVEKIIEPL